MVQSGQVKLVQIIVVGREQVDLGRLGREWEPLEVEMLPESANRLRYKRMEEK